jgi:putative transposase
VSRPLRIEFPGAVYHVTSRGGRRERIFVDDVDRLTLLSVVEQGMERYEAEVLVYCLMGNHYHFVLHTRSGNLSLLMRHINGVYTQRFNRRHGLVGHLFQGRFKAVLVDRDAYLLEVCRYVELNPVRAGIVADAAAWPWSSFCAHAGLADAPPWLDVPGLHAYMLGREAATPSDVAEAQGRYVRWVAAGRTVRLWEQALNHQVFLGDDAFVQRMQALMSASDAASPAIPTPQRTSPLSFADWLRQTGDRDRALWLAHTKSGISMTSLSAKVGLSVARVSQIVAEQRARPADSVVSLRLLRAKPTDHKVAGSQHSAPEPFEAMSQRAGPDACSFVH